MIVGDAMTTDARFEVVKEPGWPIVVMPALVDSLLQRGQTGRDALCTLLWLEVQRDGSGSSTVATSNAQLNDALGVPGERVAAALELLAGFGVIEYGSGAHE